VPGRRTGSLLSRTVSGGATAAAATLKLIRTGSAKLRLVSFAHGGVTGFDIIFGRAGQHRVSR